MSKFAVMGHGVVGSGTVELWYKNEKLIKEKQGIDLELGYILDIREFPGLPYSDRFTKDINDILNDDDVKVVAEVMGGVNPAYDFVKKCLERGKSVCTSNKELVAKKGAELIACAKAHNCSFLFEASTGGAIPIIRPMHTCLAGNEITAIEGILNGTTNYILTQMIENGTDMQTALSEAQQKGYAERDPSADIEGHDACRKICILSSLAFGRHVYPEWVHTEGITGITPEDTKTAAANGYAVKLIGSVKRCNNGKILPMVAPRFVPLTSQLGHVTDVFNAIMVHGNGFDEVMFYGKGAGKLPTASAVLGDIIDCAKASGTITACTWDDSPDDSFIEKYTDVPVSMYIRCEDVSEKEIAELFGSVKFLATDNNTVAFITPEKKESEIDALCASLGDKVKNRIRVL
ncbi:MAG: homoserine dehydrogenase [Oscillospiraceae bacterium]|nr:homoserine dehydrogenase [Oscillospiraceae bacterium]